MHNTYLLRRYYFENAVALAGAFVVLFSLMFATSVAGV